VTRDRDASLRPIFIVGAPRSGTHLLRFCLTQHSALYVAPETSFFIHAYGSRCLDRLLLGARRWSMLADRLIDRSGDPTMADVARRRDEVRQATRDSRSYAEFARRFYHSLALPSGKRRWGEKTPYHTFCLPQVFRFFPDAQVLFITRDMKATVASTIKSGHVRVGFKKAVAANLLARRTARKHAGDPRVHMVSYEAFTDHPEASLREICGFLGETFEPAMLHPGMMDSSYGGNVMELERTIGIQRDDPLKWKSALSTRQADLIDALERHPGIVSLVVRDPGLFVQFALLRMRFMAVRAGLFGIRHTLKGALPGRRKSCAPC